MDEGHPVYMFCNCFNGKEDIVKAQFRHRLCFGFCGSQDALLWPSHSIAVIKGDALGGPPTL